MTYIEQSLSAGEKVEGLFKLHWFAWMPMAMWILLAIPTFGITLFVALYEYLRLKFQEQGVTNKRLVRAARQGSLGAAHPQGLRI